MTLVRTLADIRDSGLDLVAICHGVDCRASVDVDLPKLIKAVGELASVLPVKGQPHFSERMRCPLCEARGMFIWPSIHRNPHPHMNSTLAFRVTSLDRETDAPRETFVIAGDAKVARAGLDAAKELHPLMKFEMTWHRQVIFESDPKPKRKPAKVVSLKRG